MTLTRTALLSTLCLAFAPFAHAAEPAAPATPAANAPAASLQLTFTGLETSTGRIMAALFDSEAGYAGRGAPTRALMLEIVDGRATTVVPGLAPGRYAIRAFHDVNGDGEMSTNPFGMPTEPFAFSNNARAMMGPASWATAAFDVGPTGAVQLIRID